MKKNGMLILIVYFFLYYIHMGFGSLCTRYMYDVGLTETHIGILTSVPFLVAMCFLPFFGTLADRLPKKKYLVIAAAFIASAGYFLIDIYTDFDMVKAENLQNATKFLPMLFTLIISTCMIQATNPSITSIGIEYCNNTGKDFGRIRLFGTTGYLFGTLLIGVILAKDLRYAYMWQGIALLLSGFYAFLLPDIRGHQHGGEKISPFILLKDKKMRTLLGMILIGTVTTMFYGSFYGTYMEQMQVSNSLMTVILFIGAFLEIPALFFSDKLLKKFDMWQWIIIGYVLNGIRWALLFVAMRTQVLGFIIISQLLAVSSMTTFEYFPQREVGRKIAPELSSSAQTILNVFIFGVPRIFGSLLGGIFAKKFGVSNMFLFFGCFLFTAAVILFPVARKMSRTDDGKW